MTDARIVLTTFDDLEQAKEFARHVVEEGLGACVNLVENVHSIYRWQGKIESAGEILLVIKTAANRIDALKQTISQIHPYQLPECIVLEISDGSKNYLAWLGTETKIRD